MTCEVMLGWQDFKASDTQFSIVEHLTTLQLVVEWNRALHYFSSTWFNIQHGMIHCSTFVGQQMLNCVSLA